MMGYQVMTFSLTGLALTPAGGSDCILYTHTHHDQLPTSYCAETLTAARGGSGERWMYFEISHQATTGWSRHDLCSRE